MARIPGIETIGRRFDARASAYDRNPISRWVGRSELAAMAALLPAPARPGLSPALDFGCGTGRVSELLLSLGYQVTGYDISPEMLERARQRFAIRSGVRLTGDVSVLEGSWSLIVALGVLDYYPQPELLCRQWAELLAADGVLVVTAPNARSPLAQLYAYASRWTCRAYPASLSRLTASLAAAGLRVAACRPAFPAHPLFGHTLVLRVEWA